MPNEIDLKNFVKDSVEDWIEQLASVNKLMEAGSLESVEGLLADCCGAMLLNMRHVCDLRVEAIEQSHAEDAAGASL